jgi:MtN3 and saliva related transmembrane protein
MELLAYVGTTAAICTTTAFIPQILKIRRQGGQDLSYPMLFLYLTGILLWLVYGLLLHAAAVIWANAVTTLLVAVALILKALHPAAKRVR